MQIREFAAGAAILIASATLFLILRTQQYLAVDGAIRCLSVYWQSYPVTGGNSHLLYFVNVAAWMKLLSLAGIRPANAFEFIRLAHSMNALAAAGSITLFWALCLRASGSFDAALAATSAYAFSNAFILHATSTAEPMVGLFWSIASVSAVTSGLAASSRLRIFAGGVLLLLAMATYESMVLIGPAELVLICSWDESGTGHRRILVSCFLGGCVLGGLTTYVPLYAMSGATSLPAILRRFLDMGQESRVYGGISISKLLNVPVGFSNSIVRSVPLGYQGIQSLLRAHRDDRWILLTSSLVLAMAAWLAWTAKRLVPIWSGLGHKRRVILACSAIALLFDIFPLLFWDPLYDKLWLQPLAVIFFAWSIIFAGWRSAAQPRMMLIPEAFLVITILASGLTSAASASRSSTPCLAASRNLSRILRRSDLLVANWDQVSLLYSAFWGDDAKRFDVPAVATDDGPRTLVLLNDELAKVASCRGRAYFLGVLDLSKANWDSFLGDRCHLPYHSLDRIRNCAKPVAKLACGKAEEILWQLSFDCYRP